MAEVKTTVEFKGKEIMDMITERAKAIIGKDVSGHSSTVDISGKMGNAAGPIDELHVRVNFSGPGASKKEK